MQKKFITNLLFLVSLNLLIKPFWIFGIDMTVQNTVGPAEYGFYFALFNFTLLFNIFLDVGITNFNNRNIARHHQLLSKHFSNIIGLKFLLGFLYIIIILSLALLINYNQRQIYFLLILAGNQFLWSVIMYMRSNISGLQLFKTDSMLSVTDKLLQIIVVGYLLLFHRDAFRIEWLVYAQSFTYIITATIVFFIIKAKSIDLGLKFNYQFFLVILRKSYPYALLILLMTSYTRIDSVMIERLLPDGDTEAGIYAHGYRILDAGSQYAMLFAALLLPMFAKMLSKNENVNKLVEVSFLLLVIPAITVALNLSFFKNEVINTLYYDHLEASAEVFGILILGFIPVCISYIFGTLLTANGNLKQLNIMAGIGVLLNLSLNFILIPVYKAYGAALASLITQFITALLQFLIARKIFAFKIRSKTLFTITLFTIGIACINGVFEAYITNRPLAFFAALGIGLLSSFVFKLIDLKVIWQILKYDKT